MDDSLLTALATHGNAGSINLSVDGASGIHGDSRITTTASEQNGGDINMAVGKRLTIDGHSAVSAEARGNGGNISVKLGEGLYLRDAAISALSGDNGGNITVDGLNLRSPRYIVLNNGRVIASATFQKGGDILLRSKVFVPSANSIIDASSRFGVAGNIAIEAPNTNVGASLVTLPSNLLTAENYLPERCIVRQTGQSSSLTVTTEPGVPPQPGDPLSSPTAR
jgi:hypothetical protein